MKSLWRRCRQHENVDDNIVIQKLTLPAGLEDGRVPLLFDRLCYVASALIVAFILWGSVAEIREFASASGEVVPTSLIKKVHHLEGGQVEAVRVREGQVVEEGQTLLELSPVAAKADLGQLEVRRRHLSLKMKRLHALLSGGNLTLEGRADDRFVLNEKEHFDIERRRLAKELGTIEARASQRKVEIEALESELKSLDRQKDIYAEKLGIRERLLESGYTSRRAFLEAKTDFEKAKADLIATRGRLGASEQQLAEARAEYQQVLSGAQAKYSEEYSQLAGEVAELDETIRKHQDKVGRLKITAPVRGIIQELAQHATGEVVKPGDLVAKIVPVDEAVVAEVNVEPKDIGHVKVGDPAEIKISTFDPNVYGVLNGTVERVSATTFRDDPKSPPYFKAIIKLEKGYYGSSERPISILPGMEVQADIVTGAKSLIRYLLKPVYRSLDGAFSER